MIIDHITLGVTDYERSKNFYRAALAPLGVTLLAEIGGGAGFGRAPKPEFWIGRSDKPCAVATPT